MLRRRRGISLLAFGLALAALVLVASPGLASTVVSCAFSGAPEDHADSGIIVTNYPGNNVRRLHIGYGTDTTGQYLITATIRRGAFDGPIVGSSSIYLNLDATSSTDVDGFLHFGGAFDGAPVTPGDTLTITHTWSGPGVLFFDAGTGAFGSSGNCGGAYETIGTSPPIDVQVRGTMGIEIDQEDLTSACIRSDTVLCIENNPGDARFQLTVDFNRSGTAGTGQASLGTTGLAHGGSFWFFGQDNPEILVKVLNGCAINHKFWVFLTAGTNVGFTVHVKDTLTSVTNDYSNTDGVAAVPVQDTGAFPCP
ncbi:MAG: hypothetical protein ACM3NW_02190 [Syntrophomonadaceae bacterium]